MKIVIIVLAFLFAGADKTSPSSLRAVGARPVLVAATAAYVALAGTIVLNARTDDERYTQLHKDLFSRYLSRDMRVLEVGYGPGINVERGYYPRGVHLVGLDPNLASYDPHGDTAGAATNAKAAFDLQAATGASNGIVLEALVQGVGEALPFPDASFDAAVGTLVLCTVRDPTQTIAEIARVLRPGGVFLCVEHVLADAEGAQVGQAASEALGSVDRLLATQQRVLTPLQVLLANGCHLDRRTDLLLSPPNDFSQVMEMRYETFASQYPISKQVFGALKK